MVIFELGLGIRNILDFFMDTGQRYNSSLQGGIDI